MKKRFTLSLSLLVFSCFSYQAQTLKKTTAHAQLKERSLAAPSQASKQKHRTNKATLIWGAGSTTGAAEGEFSTAFNTTGSWTATSIFDANGSPGNALWIRSTLGYSQGAYWNGTTPIASPSNGNGVAIFDSDFMDNGGTPGAFGTGASASAHKGELVSPAIDLTGYTDSAVAVSFYAYYRNFNISELSVSLSADGGITYTPPTSILNLIPQLTEGFVTAVFPNATAGVVNLTNCRIKFTFDGDYYFAILDDVSLSVSEPFDLAIQKADENGNTIADANETFQIGNNVSSLFNQINSEDLRYAANVKNLGSANVTASDNASLNLIIQENISGSWSTVYQNSTSINNITPASNGTAVYDTIANYNWIKVGDFRAIYYTVIAGDSDRSNDTLIQSFSITEDYLSKVDLDAQGRPFYDRPIFPGGTNFNKFEFGSYFSSPNGGSDQVTADSISYVYYTTNGYNGTGSQVVNAYIYEWIDGGGTGTLDGLPDALASGEHTLVASGTETLTGLFAGGAYNFSSIPFFDVNTSQAGYQMQDGKTYFISVSLEGSQFTSVNSIWFGASEQRSYALNTNTSGTLLSATQLFLEDGSGSPSGNWLGFGADVVPSFGVHLNNTPPALANLVISEIMYNPPESGTDSIEYIEIYNADTLTINLDGYTFAQGVTHTFTSGDTIGKDEFKVIAVDSAAFRNVFGYSANYQWNTGGLSNGGEDIVLHDNLGRTVDSVDYDDGGSWPAGFSAGQPDGGGSSIELTQINTDNNLGANWMASLEGTAYIVNGLEIFGSPGYFPLELSFTSTDIDCNGAFNGTASVSVNGGFSPYSYNWSNGSSGNAISNVAAGTYTVTVTDDVGTSKIDFVIISQPAAVAASVVIDSNISCNGGTDGGATASATGGTGAYTYLWSNAATTASITGVASGTYSATITDANGCAATNSATITEPTALSATVAINSNVSCNGGTDGGATASATGGTGAYTYLWSTGASTASITGLAAGTYSATITDANGCAATNSATITEPTALSATVAINSNVSCNGANDGGATASASGGTGAYTYLWSTGASTASITGLAAGTYSATITDANGCAATNSATITEPTALSATVAINSNVSCNGANDGGATASASGGTGAYTYLWSTGASTASITGLAVGTYFATITDANGCVDIDFAAITQPTVLAASVVIDSNISCNGGTDGGATASATGGTGAYTYLWSNAATTASITGVASGTYSATITDANGCAATNSATITEPTALVINASIVSTSCNGANDGSISLSASGGTPPFTYAWSSGLPFTANQSNLAAGTYFVTLTDGNACTITDNYVISQPTAIVTTVTQAGPNLTADQSGAVYQWLDCNNGNAPISGETAQNFTATANGDYAVEITLINCIDTSACINVTSVGFEDLNSQQIAFNLFPNPSRGKLTISLDNSTFQNERMRIFDLTGKVVRDQFINGNTIRLDIHDLNSGIYFVEIGNQRRKVILAN